jgi:transaldolase
MKKTKNQKNADQSSILTIDNLKVKLFADGADKTGMLEMAAKPFIKGLTTNPTLMRKAGITDYKSFALDVLKDIPDKPISFEVFSDDFEEMERQAIQIANWGKNVYVKVPITNTHSESACDLVRKLSKRRIKLNVTALMTLKQVREVVESLDPEVPSYISVFAGRIADTGVDPLPIMREAVELIGNGTKAELIWASPRELLNVFHADSVGCHIITATNDILKKLELIGKDLDEYSLDTVKMFYKDAKTAGFSL